MSGCRREFAADGFFNFRFAPLVVAREFPNRLASLVAFGNQTGCEPGTGKYRSSSRKKRVDYDQSGRICRPGTREGVQSNRYAGRVPIDTLEANR